MNPEHKYHTDNKKALTRDTHARFYQQDLLNADYESLKSLAEEKNMSVRALMLEAIRKYFGDWDLRLLLDIETVTLNDGRKRVFLWLPYEIFDEFELLAKGKGVFVEELVRAALKEFNSIGGN